MASIMRARFASLFTSGTATELCKIPLKRLDVFHIQIATISSKGARKHRPPRLPPFDWRKKGISYWTQLMDPMFDRFDDNTKVICIEGMPGVGKDKLGRQLADELEMQYIPPPNFDHAFITEYGFDYRSLDDQLPEDMKMHDVSLFHKNPFHRNIPAVQVQFFTLRTCNYVTALADLLNSGVGIVTHRSPYSDLVFVDAMYECDYLTPEARKTLYRSSSLVLHQLMRPHLHIYLDAPISVIKENIKKRNDPYESKSKALTDKYLEELERIYKNFIKQRGTHGHVLTYDWSTEGDYTAIVEDIERLNFDYNVFVRNRFIDWDYRNAVELKVKREEYSCNLEKILLDIDHRNADIPELTWSFYEVEKLNEILRKVPLEKYIPDFDDDTTKGRLIRKQLMRQDM